MSAKDLLAAIISGDKEAAASTFDSLMAEKTSEKIDELRITVAQKMFGEGKTPYEVGKDEKEAEDADEAADEADKKVTKDKGGDDSDSKEAETDAGEDDSDDKDDSEDDSDDKADDSNFKKKVSEEVDLNDSTELEEGFHVYHKVKGWYIYGPETHHISSHDTKEEAEAAAAKYKKSGNVPSNRFHSVVIRTRKIKVNEEAEWDSQK